MHCCAESIALQRLSAGRAEAKHYWKMTAIALIAAKVRHDAILLTAAKHASSLFMP